MSDDLDIEGWPIPDDIPMEPTGGMDKFVEKVFQALTLRRLRGSHNVLRVPLPENLWKIQQDLGVYIRLMDDPSTVVNHYTVMFPHVGVTPLSLMLHGRINPAPDHHPFVFANGAN